MNRELRFWSAVDRLLVAGLARAGGDKVAVLRLDAIGDFVVWQPYARFIREALPGREIVLLCPPANAELARTLPFWDRVETLDVQRFEHSLRYRWQTLRRLRGEGFATLLHPVYSRTGTADLLVRAIAAPESIGLDGDEVNLPGGMKRQSDRWYTKLVPSAKARLPETTRHRDFMAALLGRPVAAVEPALPPTGAGVPAALRDADYAILFPGAAAPGRRWPRERFVEVGRWLQAERGWLPVVAGSAADAEAAAAICEGLGPAAVNLAGGTTLLELVETIRGARFVVSNETSAVHIAAATRTPAVAVLGGGHFGRFMPYVVAGLPSQAPRAVFATMDCFHCDWRCRYAVAREAPKPCIDAVSVGDVIDTLRGMIEEKIV